MLQQGLEYIALSLNPHTKYVDVERNGYMVVDFDHTRASCEYYHLDDVKDPDSGEFMAAEVQTWEGANRVEFTYLL